MVEAGRVDGFPHRVFAGEGFVNVEEEGLVVYSPDSPLPDSGIFLRGSIDPTGAPEFILFLDGVAEPLYLWQ